MQIVQKIVSTLRFIGAYIVANFQAEMEYRTAFVTQVIAMMLNDGLWIFFWFNYFRQFPIVHGWQANDIVILWSVAACGFGVGTGIFGNAGRIPTLIVNGGLDAYLGMPRHILLHVCVSRMSASAWGDVLFGLFAFLLVVRPDLPHFALFVLLVLLVGCIYTAFQVIVGCMTFYLGNIQGLAEQLFGAMISFSTYPMDIFHGAIRLLLFTAIPAGFVSFVPLQLLHQFTWPLFAGMIGATALLIGIALAMFSIGLRRYESGNLLGMQG